jgi:hypothetical protein
LNSCREYSVYEDSYDDDDEYLKESEIMMHNRSDTTISLSNIVRKDKN